MNALVGFVCGHLSPRHFGIVVLSGHVSFRARLILLGRPFLRRDSSPVAAPAVSFALPFTDSTTDDTAALGPVSLFMPSFFSCWRLQSESQAVNQRLPAEKTVAPSPLTTSDGEADEPEDEENYSQDPQHVDSESQAGDDQDR